MIHVKEVVVDFGVTVNLGNYENMRLGVQIKADMSADDVDNGALNVLLEDARKEVAFGLFDLAEVKLRAVGRWELEDDRNERIAISSSTEFRWLMKLHPEMAADLLANIVNDYWEAKSPSVPVIAPEDAKAIVDGAVPAEDPSLTLPVNGAGTDDDEPNDDAPDFDDSDVDYYDEPEDDEPELSAEEIEDLFDSETDEPEDAPDDEPDDDGQDEEDSPF